MVTRDNVERLRKQEVRKQAAEVKALADLSSESTKSKPSRRHSTATNTTKSGETSEQSETNKEQLKMMRKRSVPVPASATLETSTTSDVLGLEDKSMDRSLQSRSIQRQQSSRRNSVI